MKMNDVVKRAKGFGINTRAAKKSDLIKQIQKAEGNFDCFGTAIAYCDQWVCCFREDCLPLEKPEDKKPKHVKQANRRIR